MGHVRLHVRGARGTLVALAIVACIAGTLAAVLPARRAGRMSVLGALADV